MVAMAADLQDPIIISDKTSSYGENFFIIPTFGNDKKSNFCIYEYDRYNTSTSSLFTIYDDNIDIEKEITVNLIPRTIKKYRQEEEVISLNFIGIERTGYRRAIPSAGKDINKVAEIMKNDYGYGDQVQVTNLPTGEQIIAISYVMSKKFGEKYPSEFYILSDDPLYDTYWEKCYAEYDYVTGYDPNGEIKETTSTYYIKVPSVVIRPESGGDDGWYEITRGIFSNDFNYILPVPEEVPFSKEYDDFKEWGTQTMIKGFNVYDIDHNLLQTISFPTGYYMDPWNGSVGADYVCLSGKHYLFFAAKEETADEYSYLIYRLDGTSKANLVATAPAGKISPRSPRKGETVTVEIDERFSNETCLVNVCSTDGRNLVQKTINPGETSISFSTAGFPHGVYIVNVTGKAGKIETAKIIVH